MRLGGSGTANALAMVALVVAVGTGGAYAAGLIGPNDIAKDAVRAKHIKANQVAPKHLSALTAVVNVRPPSSSTNCDTAGPPPVGEFCGLGTGATPWSNYGEGFERAGFFKDGSGLVHLQGVVYAGGPHEASVHREIFRLPPAFRPTAQRQFPVVGEATHVNIRPDGLVISEDVPPTSSISLDGISYRP